MGRQPRSGDSPWLPAHSILKRIGGDTSMLDPLSQKSSVLSLIPQKSLTIVLKYAPSWTLVSFWDSACVDTKPCRMLGLMVSCSPLSLEILSSTRFLSNSRHGRNAQTSRGI